MNNDPTRPNRLLNPFNSEPNAQQGPFIGGQAQDMSNLGGAQNPNSGNPSTSRRNLLMAIIGGAAAAAAAGGLVILKGCESDDQTGIPLDKTDQEPLPTVPNQSEVCSTAFEVKGVDHGDRNRWFAEGIPSIKTASTPEEARNALGDWLYGTDEHPGVKDDPQLTTAVYNIIRPEDSIAITADGMVDDNGCATPKMVDAITNIKTWLVFADVTTGTAPANGINTGTNSKGVATIASKAGVYGDDESRKSIVVRLKDGTEIFIMCRCGQPVLTHPGRGNLPEGPTDDDGGHDTTTTTTEPGKNPKHDDGRLPGNPDVPADQDKGTPDKPGVGPAGQTPDPDGYIPTETRPQAPPTTRPHEPQSPTTTGRPPATTTPAPTSTNPPVTATTSVSTTVPQGNPRPTQP